MRQVRNNVFETNSSSTHSIAIPKNCETNNFISFHVGDFGWGWVEVDPADYFYTAIYETSNTEEELKQKLDKLSSILESRGISYKFFPVKYHTSVYEGTCYLSLDDGIDGEMTSASMYVDMVKREFARNSCSTNRYPITDKIEDMFSFLKTK